MTGVANQKKGSWGGRRAGAGRPKGRRMENDRITVTFPKEAMEEMRRLASADSKCLSAFIRDRIDLSGKGPLLSPETDS